ncbi:MAG TPA: hypothetical protein VFH61_03600, partial [Thermoleophilia bacterium]|nr:hypothetical protein [Thermoleophilia bacterium]
AFAQFGSDLDETTKRSLSRGERMIQVLNQGLLDPLPVEEQVAVIFAGTQGYIDDIEVARVSTFTDDLRGYLRSQTPGVLADIRETKKLSPENEAALRDAIVAFHASFAPATIVSDVPAEASGSADPAAGAGA